MRSWSIAIYFVCVTAILWCGSTTLPAAIISNADIIDLQVILPKGWELNSTNDSYTIEDYAALFDGVTENSKSVGRVLWKKLQSGEPLSSNEDRYISIAVALNGPFEVNALGFVHDWGSIPDQEIGAASVNLANADGSLGVFTKTGLNGGSAVTDDVQYVFNNASVSPVTTFEVRITESDAGTESDFVELREIVVQANAVPEPASYLIFGGLAVCFVLAGAWKRRRLRR